MICSERLQVRFFLTDFSFLRLVSFFITSFTIIRTCVLLKKYIIVHLLNQYSRPRYQFGQFYFYLFLRFCIIANDADLHYKTCCYDKFDTL